MKWASNILEAWWGVDHWNNDYLCIHV